MRRFLPIAIVAVICCLGSRTSSAQSTRPLTVWIDTLQQNVCGAKNFQIPIHVGELYFSDSIVGFTLTVYYDRSTLDFDNLVVTPSGTLARTANVVQVSKDAETGVLYIQAADTTLKRYMAGKGPLLYLVGTITAPDTISTATTRIDTITLGGILRERTTPTGPAQIEA